MTTLSLNFLKFQMNKKITIFFLALIFLSNCSFDNKTGIWSGDESEKRRISELEKKQKETISTDIIFSSDKIYKVDKNLVKKINLSQPIKNFSWETHSLNNQNFIGNLYLSGSKNRFLKKKIGKNKHSTSKISSSPLIYNNNIFLADNNGTIFKVDKNGSVNWKVNIYKKIYKKVYKNLTFSIYKNKIFVADNIGFVYALNPDNGKLVWIKNHGIPFKSRIKVSKDKIVLINQDNRLLCFDIKDGSVIWDVRSIESFIKSQNFLSVAITEQGDVLTSNSTGELFKVSILNGQMYWSINTLESMLAHATDFFKSSDIVIDNNNIIFSTQSSTFSYNLEEGYANWQTEISSVGAPIINQNYIFLVTENGYFSILEKDTGKIVSSTNIFKVLKKKKQATKVTGFIMGSGKIYTVTLNGYLIISSASTGKVENFKKIGDSITSSPVINDGKIFVYTMDSKLLGFN